MTVPAPWQPILKRLMQSLSERGFAAYIDCVAASLPDRCRIHPDGAGLLTLQLMRTIPQVLLAVGVIGLGMAIVLPTLAATILWVAGDREGESFGLQSSAQSTGQVIGPLIGGILFSWYAQLPYLVAGSSLIGIGILTAFKRSSADRTKS